MDRPSLPRHSWHAIGGEVVFDIAARIACNIVRARHANVTRAMHVNRNSNHCDEIHARCVACVFDMSRFALCGCDPRCRSGMRHTAAAARRCRAAG
jgi:hypothetical protein